MFYATWWEIGHPDEHAECEHLRDVYCNSDVPDTERLEAAEELRMRHGVEVTEERDPRPADWINRGWAFTRPQA